MRPHRGTGAGVGVGVGGCLGFCECKQDLPATLLGGSGAPGAAETESGSFSLCPAPLGGAPAWGPVLGAASPDP